MMATERMTFDSWSSDPDDEMLAIGGRRAAVRHDPSGHEDCAREWDVCACHGDRLCQLGKVMRWYQSSIRYFEDAEQEQKIAKVTYDLERQLVGWSGRISDETVRRANETTMKLYLARRSTTSFPSEIWPMLLANARQAFANGTV